MDKLRVTNVVWQLLQSFVGKGDVAIDATVGNGFDTLFLAQRVGSQGLVFGFDIQEQAIASTRKRLTDEDCQCSVELYQVGHQHMADTIPQSYKGLISCVIFNLGFLPGGDKSIHTTSQNSIQAVRTSLEYLKVGGCTVIAIYTGHQEGERELKELSSLVASLSSQSWSVGKFEILNRNNPPMIYLIHRTK